MSADARAKIRALFAESAPVGPEPTAGDDALVIPIGALTMHPDDIRSPELRRLAAATVDTWVACGGRTTRAVLRAGVAEREPDLVEYLDWIEARVDPADRAPLPATPATMRRLRWSLAALRIKAALHEIDLLTGILRDAPDDGDAAAALRGRLAEIRDLERLHPGATTKARAELAREKTMPAQRAPLTERRV